MTASIPSMKDYSETMAFAYLTQYKGNTKSLYTCHMRIFFEWCVRNDLQPLSLTKLNLDQFRIYLEEERHNSISSINARLTMLKGFYRYCADEGCLVKSPAERLKIPKVQRDESRLVGLSRLELSTLLQTAKSTSPEKWALVSLLGLLGLRVSEAISVNVEDIHGENRGYRTLSIIGKGEKPATIPITVPVGRALDSAASDRVSGPLLLRADGQRLDRRCAYRWVQQLARKAGLDNKKIHPHTLRHAFVTLSLDAGVPLRDVQYAARHADPRMTERYDRARGSMDRHAVHYLTAYVSGI